MSERELIPAVWVGPGDVKVPGGATLRYGDEHMVPPGEAKNSDHWRPVKQPAAPKTTKDDA